MTVLLKDDGDMAKKFDEDTKAKVLYHHQIADLFYFYDYSEQICSDFMSLYRQGLYLHHYKFKGDKRIVVFSPKTIMAASSVRVDPMAFNYGYIVQGMAYAFKKKCIVCSKDTNNLCGRCKVIFYCGKDCQCADFACHKNMCKMVHQDRVDNGRSFDENLN